MVLKMLLYCSFLLMLKEFLHSQSIRTVLALFAVLFVCDVTSFVPETWSNAVAKSGFRLFLLVTHDMIILMGACTEISTSYLFIALRSS